MSIEYENFEYGIQRRYLDQGAIVEVKTEGNMTRAAIDTWAGVIKDAIDQWEAGKPFYLLADVSHPDQGMTPYASQRTSEIFDYVPPDKPMYVAVILPATIIFRLVALFIRQRREKNITARLFLSAEDGLDWLRQIQPDQESI